MGDFSDFYNKQITLISETAGDMVGGRYKKGETTSKTIDCDVQPADRTKTYSEYGFVTEAAYTVFCDPDKDITEGKTVTYNEVDYTIEKLIDWDDYYILYLKAVV